MTTIYYKPARLAMWALLWGLSGGYTLFGWSDDNSTLNTIIGGVLLAMGVFAGYAAMVSRPALAGDTTGLTVRTMFARRTVRCR